MNINHFVILCTGMGGTGCIFIIIGKINNEEINVLTMIKPKNKKA
jgi:hypothetical protein